MMIRPTSRTTIALLAAIAATTTTSFQGATFATATQSVHDCLAHGCPLLPLDIQQDAVATAALDELRGLHKEQEETTSGNRTEKRDAALLALKASGDWDKVTLTLRGDKGGPPSEQINQDSAMIYSPFQIASAKTEQQHEIRAQLLGVFDGHGTLGELTSRHAVSEIPRLLANKLSQLPSLEDDSGVTNAIHESFVETDKSDPSEGEGGCTASIVLQIGPKLYIGNTGDSASFVAVRVGDEVEVVYVSREDKPDLPEERKRITEMGGYVHIPSDPQEDVPRAYAVDESGRATYGVAMSRSLGDWSVQGVIPDPIVDVLHVDDILAAAKKQYVEKCQAQQVEEEEKKDQGGEESCDKIAVDKFGILAVSATDGMMDFLSEEQISEVFAYSFFLEDDFHPHTAAEHLIVSAAKYWHQVYGGEYRDDIAVAAVKIHIRSDAESMAAGEAQRNEL